MFIVRLTRAAAIVAFVTLLLAACGDSLSEFTIDRALEASGEDVDFDFEDGGFSVSGEEGEVTFNFDSEDGTFSFSDGQDAGTVQLDDEGNIVIETDEGDATFSIDAEGGSATFSSEDGSGFSSQAVPASWPAVFGVPTTLIESQSVFSVFEDSTGTGYSANLTHDPSEDFVGAVEARLAAAGFEKLDLGATASGFSQWEGQGLFVIVSGTDGQSTIIASPG